MDVPCWGALAGVFSAAIAATFDVAAMLVSSGFLILD